MRFPYSKHHLYNQVCSVLCVTVVLPRISQKGLASICWEGTGILSTLQHRQHSLPPYRRFHLVHIPTVDRDNFQEMADKLPLWYRAFFQYIEPTSAVIGAYFAVFRQSEYLDLTHSPSAPPIGIPLGTSIALTQLGNLYLLFALIEGLVLRSTNDVKVWRAVMISMLIADLGHLYSVGPLGWEVFYDVKNYNAIDYGNVLFVYAGTLTRSLFLLGFGQASSSPSSSSAAAVRRRQRISSTKKS